MLTAPPTELVRGDSKAWDMVLPDYPASDGWRVSIHFIAPTQKVSVQGVPSGDDHTFTLTKEKSSELKPVGEYRWQAVAERGIDRSTIQSGLLLVLEGFATVGSGHDARSQAEKMLEAIDEALLEAAKDGGGGSIALDGVSMQYATLEELERSRNYWFRKLKRQKGGTDRTVRPKFGAAL